MTSAPRDDTNPVAGVDPIRSGRIGTAVAIGLVLLGAAVLPEGGVRGAGVAAALALAALVLVFDVVRQRRRVNLDESRREGARFRVLAEHSTDMIVEADLDMVRHYVSPRATDLLGFAPEELLGRRVLELVHPDDAPACRDAFASLLDGSRDRVITTQRYRRKDGSYLWTEANVQLTRDASGAPTGYIGSLRDIEARRAAETALCDSESLLRGVIDGSPDGIQVLDLDGRVTLVSRNGLRMFPAAMRDGLVGGDDDAPWPSSGAQQARSAVAAATAGAPARFRAEVPSDGDRITHLDVLVMPIVDTANVPQRLLVLTRDVTAAVEADAELRSSQDRYRLLAENSSDIVLLRVPEPSGLVLYASPSCLRVLGHAAETLIGADASDLLHPDDKARVEGLVADLDPASGIVLDTHRVRRADGVFIWVETAFQRTERAGAPVVVAVLRDITERQRRAEDLAAAKDMAERAQKVAEDASLAKSDFLAVMSHEIRTPLNSIIGFTDLMLDAGDLPTTSRRQAELIRAAGSALLTVVNDILDFSKIEAGAVELEAIAFDPVGLARQSAAILGGYAGTKALDIDVEIGDGLPAVVVGDEARLRQILLNLLNNAVKFTNGGRVVLRVEALGPASAGETLRFEVEDTGIGIAEAQQHRLFERFSQVDTSVARRFGGSGLGLAICKRLVGLMGGEIGVVSREGEGSIFWFTVVLPGAGAPVAAPALRSRRSARILVVEDLDINGRLAVALLEAAGHEGHVVSDGAAAVAAVAEGDFDLVLMDVRMPGMDGVTATRLIRASDGPHATVPIIAMTANVYPEQIEACRRAGMDDHVGKPLNRSQLYATIDRWVGPAAAISDRRAADPGPVALPAAIPAFDAATYGQLRGVLGAARLDDVLARFAAALPQHFEPGEETLDRIGRWKTDAQMVASVAGMTGFADLAQRCRAFEAAAPGSDGYTAKLDAMRRARDAVLPVLDDLRRDLMVPPARDSSAA